MRRVAATGEDLTAAAHDTALAVDYQALKTDGGGVDLAELEAMADPVRESARALHDAQDVVDDVASPWLAPPISDRIDRLSTRLTENASSADQAALAVTAAPRLLGADGEVRYLLALATPAESRGAGGFVGSFGVLSVSDGQLALGRTASTQETNVDPGGTPRAFDPPPDWEERYRTYHVDLFPGNVSASPDWPTDTDVALQIYPQIDGVGPLDGTIYADPEALAALLSLTGPVEVDGLGFALTEDNVAGFLLYDQYELFDQDAASRRDLLGEVVTSVFDALVAQPLPDVKDVVDALGPAVAAGHLKVAVPGGEAEELLDSIGLSGRWDPTPGADYVSVRSVDLVSNKMDYFLERSVEVEVDLDDEARTVGSTVRVTVTNTAPDTGLPLYVAGVAEGPYHGDARDGIELYSPLQLDEVTIDGEEALVQNQREFGGNVYSVPVTIAAGQTRTIEYHLSGAVDDGAYQLDVLPQPLWTPDALTVRFGRGGGPPEVLFDGPLDRVLRLTPEADAG